MITEKDSSCIANESQENQLLSLLLSTQGELVSPLFHSTLLLWLSWLQKLSPIDFPLWLTLNGLGSLGATTTATAKNLQPPRLHLAFRACMMMPFPGDFRKDRKLPYVSYFSTFGISLLLVSTSSHPLMNQLTNKH